MTDGVFLSMHEYPLPEAGGRPEAPTSFIQYAISP